MKYHKPALKNHLLSGINKPEIEQSEVLLKTINLLRSSHTFIEIISLKVAETIAVKGFQDLDRLTYLSTWLGNVTVVILGLINKYLRQLLISISLSIIHLSLYGIGNSPILTVPPKTILTRKISRLILRNERNNSFSFL